MCCINNKDVLLDIHSFVSHIILSMNYMPVTECHTVLGTMMKKTQPYPRGHLQIGGKKDALDMEIHGKPCIHL